MYTFDDRKKDYQHAYKLFGNSPKSLQWVSRHSMDIRFYQFLNELDFKGKSVIDVGCGLGNLVDAIKKQTIDFSYLGVDLVPEFVKEAQKKYPHRRFLELNYFDNPLENSFDIVIASGCLNYNQGVNTLEYRKHYIETMFNHSSYALAFNMAGFHPQPQNQPSAKVYYADSFDVFNFCQTLSSKIILKQHYDPLDFTIILFR